MKLTAQLKLQPTPAQADALQRTLKRTNAACNYISESAWEAQTFRQFDLHKLCYREVRERFGLAAQVVVRAISKVADAYKLDRDTQRTFRPLGSIEFKPRDCRLQATAEEAFSISRRRRRPFFGC